MKKVSFILLIICFAVCICSCRQEEMEPGKMTAIKFDQNELLLDAEESTILLHTNNGSWDVSSVIVEDAKGTRTYIGLDEEVYTLIQGNQRRNVGKAEFDEWFRFSRPRTNDWKDLEIHLDKNTSGKSRKLTVGIEGRIGFMGANIVINQEDSPVTSGL